VCRQAYGSDVSQWTRQQIINAAGIVTGLMPSEVERLKLLDLECISAVGRHGKWSSTQVSHSDSKQLAPHSVTLLFSLISLSSD